jgi:hypothetical protein
MDLLDLAVDLIRRLREVRTTSIQGGSAGERLKKKIENRYF